LAGTESLGSFIGMGLGIRITVLDCTFCSILPLYEEWEMEEEGYLATLSYTQLFIYLCPL